MVTYHQEKKWIWEGRNFPNFVFENISLDTLNYKFGQLDMVEKFMNEDDTNQLQLEQLLNEALSTSAIEGETLQRSSVRSSINKILKLGLEDDYSYTRESDALIEILIDAKTNKEPLNKQRILKWHKALFPTGSSGLRDINVGSYRTDTEDMQIVSGAWNREKVHYIAPASSNIEELMYEFLLWLNSDSELGSIYKATIAHLYFVLIHPFDDGNGRIARAITDYVLAESSFANPKFYSISTIIYQKRKEYYEVLDKVCTQTNQDISLWIQWFLQLLEESIDSTLVAIEAVQVKVKFWNRHRETKLNERQKKVIFKMLSYLPQEFEGGMKVQKYMSITKSTRLTASRDLSDLVSKEIMSNHGKGRGVYYSLVL
ncbi:Fic family protein [Sulfurimonas sp.]|jgi:Fic family protein|uniref:Fic family protein n=1 Tax=Sulfurimonas sp. TaxID=2022749 RepID=UPI0025E37478|nr:Fic family protein [Sulfurimonas sp.]MBT5934858.1 Fic family protein [Sulfurimonas sp.]